MIHRTDLLTCYELLYISYNLLQTIRNCFVKDLVHYCLQGDTVVLLCKGNTTAKAGLIPPQRYSPLQFGKKFSQQIIPCRGQICNELFYFHYLFFLFITNQSWFPGGNTK